MVIACCTFDQSPLRKASATRVARLYRKRWTLETAFQHLEAYFHSEINTLGYPKAALFGFAWPWSPTIVVGHVWCTGGVGD